MTLALILSLAALSVQSDSASNAAIRRTIEEHYFKAHVAIAQGRARQPSSAFRRRHDRRFTSLTASSAVTMS